MGSGERGLPALGLCSHRRCWGIWSLCQHPQDGLLGQLVNLRAGDGLKAARGLVLVDNGYGRLLGAFSKALTDTNLLVPIKEHLLLDRSCKAKHQVGL